MYTLTLANVYSSSCSDVWHSNFAILPNTVYRGTSTCSPGALIAAQSLNKGWSQSKQRLARHQSSCWGSRPFEGWLVARSTTILSINPLESLTLREPFHNCGRFADFRARLGLMRVGLVEESSLHQFATRLTAAVICAGGGVGRW